LLDSRESSKNVNPVNWKTNSTNPNWQESSRTQQERELKKALKELESMKEDGLQLAATVGRSVHLLTVHQAYGYEYYLSKKRRVPLPDSEIEYQFEASSPSEQECANADNFDMSPAGSDDPAPAVGSEIPAEALKTSEVAPAVQLPSGKLRLNPVQFTHKSGMMYITYQLEDGRLLEPKTTLPFRQPSQSAFYPVESIPPLLNPCVPYQGFVSTAARSSQPSQRPLLQIDYSPESQTNFRSDKPGQRERYSVSKLEGELTF
jgi:hypothetical protein